MARYHRSVPANPATPAGLERFKAALAALRRYLALLALLAGCVPAATARPDHSPTPAHCDLACPGGIATTWDGTVDPATTAVELSANCTADLLAAGCTAPACACEVRR